MYFNFIYIGLKHLPYQCLQTSFLEQIMGNISPEIIQFETNEHDLDPGPEKLSEHGACSDYIYMIPLTSQFQHFDQVSREW